VTDLTRLRDLPELPPSHGQAETALAQVRTRRLRSALTTVTSTVAAVVAVTVLMTHPGGPHSLRPADSPLPRTATAVPTPTGHGGEAHRASGPRFATVSPEASGGGEVTGPVHDPGATLAAGATPRPAVVRYDYSSYTNPNRIVDGRHYTQPCGPGVGAPSSPSGCHGALSRDEDCAAATLPS
jgi:hypothetical protein